MALVHEYLGYNRFGLRYVTAEEIRQRKERILKHDLSPKKDIQQPSQDNKAIEWLCAFLALTIAYQEARKPVFKNFWPLKRFAREKLINSR